MALTPDQMLASKAIDVIVSVTEKRIKKAQAGQQDSSSVGIPWRRFLELVDEVEQQYPGVIADTRKLIAEQKNEKEAR